MARLSSKWWAKTQPMKFRGTLLKSIQDFETAVKTKNTAQIYESIFTMRNEMSFDRNLLRKHLRANPAKLKSVLGELDDLETLFTREEKSLAKNGASEIKVWSRDFSDAIAKVYSSGHIRLDGGTVELKLDLATIHAIENIGADARLFRELNDLFDDAVDSSCKDIELAMKTQNGQPLKKLQMMSLHDQAKKRLANLQKDLIKSANGAAAKAASQHKAAASMSPSRRCPSLEVRQASHCREQLLWRL